MEWEEVHKVSKKNEEVTIAEGQEVTVEQAPESAGVSAGDFAMHLLGMVQAAVQQAGGTLYHKSMVNNPDGPLPMMILIAVGQEALALSELLQSAPTEPDVVTPVSTSVN